MEFWTSRKGLSPLIAAVLLIVVVVGIGAVVTGIVRNYVTENKQTITEKASDMKCGVEVSLNVPTVNDQLLVCNGSSYVDVTLENTGSAAIDDIQLKVFGASGFAANDTAWTSNTTLGTTSFASGDTQQLRLYYAGTIGELQQIKIVPRVKVVGRSDKAYCTDAALTFSDFVGCT
ncbi:hypothetical protein KY363_03255 [Candidatus Woesearchaeota archaeon]|nr:hypothetical protein [Candidatus Woesearchaeota archaeon]